MKKAIFLVLVLSGLALAHKEPTHQYIVREAYKLLKMDRGHIPVLETHIGDTQGRGDNYQWASPYVVGGAWNEDHQDPIYRHGEPIDIFGLWNYSMVSISHFWRINGSGLHDQDEHTTELAPLGVEVIHSENAWQRLRAYRDGGWDVYVKGDGSSFGHIYRYYGLTSLYATRRVLWVCSFNSAGQQTTRNQWITLEPGFTMYLVYNILGRMAHCLADMSVPAHVHDDEHGTWSDFYEDVMNVESARLGSWASHWNATNVLSSKGGIIDPFVSGDDPIHYLAYTVDQIADFFPSNRVDGNNAYCSIGSIESTLQNLGTPKTASDYENFGFSDYETIRDATFPYVIRATAGLFYWFAVESGLIPNGIWVPTAYPTIEAALASASAGQTVIVAPGIYTVSNSISVPSGVTLQLQSGVTLNFAPGITLNVSGKLIGNGSSVNRIQLTNLSQSYWSGISFSGSNASSLQYCDINYASSPIVAVNSTNLTINNCTIGDSHFYGTSPYWSQAAMAFYNSSVNISNTTINGRGDSWNGVRFAQGSTGTLQYSEIKNCGAGNGIVVQGGSSPTINGNSIHDNHYNGIFVIGNLYGSPVITGNYVASNGLLNPQYRYYHGIVFNNSLGELRNNTVTNSDCGIITWENASVNSGWSWSVPGGNRVINNNTALLAYYYSSIYFGWVDGYDPTYFYGGCNHFEINPANIHSWNDSYVLAQGNWWGEEYPNPSKFFSAGGGIYDYTPWKVYPDMWCEPEYAGGGWEAVAAPDPNAIVQSASERNRLDEAKRAYLKRDLAGSEAIYKDILSRTTRSDNRIRAMTGLYSLARESKNTGLVGEIARLRNESGKVGAIASELSASMYAAAGQYAQAKQIVNEIKSKHPGTDNERRALTLLAALKGANSNERATSVQAIAELKQKFGSSVGADLLAALGSDNSVAPYSPSGTTRHNDIALTSHPNPFNPSTTIGFTLGSASFVTLKIYDMLGREVAVLVNEQRNAGSHRVSWDASRFSSGIYFSRLEINGRSLTQKLLLTK